jgi:hypothetical protein
MNKILSQFIRLEVKAALGAPVQLSELRKDLPGMNRTKFDQDILDLVKSGEYILIRHLYPDSLKMQEKVMMISDGEGGFYDAIIPRPEKKPTTSGRRRRSSTLRPKGRLLTT